MPELFDGVCDRVFALPDFDECVDDGGPSVVDGDAQDLDLQAVVGLADGPDRRLRVQQARHASQSARSTVST